MPVCDLALGGNTGDVAATIDRALALLPSRGVDVITRSRLYETEPMGVSAGGSFLNAAAEVTTNLAARDLLNALHQVEDELGRRRTERWGPRSIDLDLIFYGHERIDEPGLTVPHPAAWHRRFVLDPLAEIAPQSFHPGFGLRTEQLRERLLPRPLSVALIGADHAAVDAASRRLRDEFGERLRFVNDPLRAVVAFRLGDVASSPNMPWAVDVAAMPGGSQPMIDVLTAALDEPRPID